MTDQTATFSEHIVGHAHQLQEKTLTKQEQFAMAAMTSLITSGHGFNPAHVIAGNAVAYANALIAAIENDNKGA